MRQDLEWSELALNSLPSCLALVLGLYVSATMLALVSVLRNVGRAAVANVQEGKRSTIWLRMRWEEIP